MPGRFDINDPLGAGGNRLKLCQVCFGAALSVDRSGESSLVHLDRRVV
jgi:hypothetical protein